MDKILYPKRFQKLDPRLQWGISTMWPAVLLVGIGYAAFLSFALLAMGMNPVSATSIYLDGALFALDPIIATCMGGWILFAYLYSVTAMPARAIEQGQSSNHTGFYAFTTFLIGLVLRLLPARVPFFTRSLAPAEPSESSTNLFARRDPPLRQTDRWLHGHHPPLVYE